MKTIRNNVFETNSSSTHSVTIFEAEDYEKFKNGELLYYYENDVLVTLDEAVLILVDLLCDEEIKLRIKSEKLEYSEILDEYDEFLDQFSIPKSFSDLYNFNNLETDYTPFTTKSGDKIVIMCRYGYDS